MCIVVTCTCVVVTCTCIVVTCTCNIIIIKTSGTGPIKVGNTKLFINCLRNLTSTCATEKLKNIHRDATND